MRSTPSEHAGTLLPKCSHYSGVNRMPLAAVTASPQTGRRLGILNLLLILWSVPEPAILLVLIYMHGTRIYMHGMVVDSIAAC